MMVTALIVSLTMAPGLLQTKAIAGWPPLSPSDLPNTVFVIHEIRGKATIVRAGNTYSISSFTCKQRMADKAVPHRLLIVNNDQFWLDTKSFAKISFLSNDGSCVNESAIEVGKDYREPKIRNKNYAALSRAAVLQIRQLVNFGGNSKPLEAKFDPQIIWPRKDELAPANRLSIRLWNRGAASWGHARVSYVLAMGELEIWSGNPTAQSSLSIDRTLLMSKLKSQFGSTEHWANKPVPLRFSVKLGGEELFQDFFLPTPEREKQILSSIADLNKVLSERPSYERDLKLTQLCAALSDCPSIVLEVLWPKRTDRSVESIIAVLCEEHQIPLELL